MPVAQRTAGHGPQGSGAPRWLNPDDEDQVQDWIVATASQRGAHHEHGGRPNEDHARADLGTAPGVITVADGHGASQYTRADRGSRLATRAAIDVLRSHHDDREALPAALVERWRELVAADVEQDPPPREEVAHRDPHELYGTTLLATADLGDRLLLVQLGDGDTVLARCGDGQVRRPLPPVKYAFPGATDSLVQDDASSAVRIAEVERAEFDPDLVLLATDGLDASQPGRDWHADVTNELCRQLEGLDADQVAGLVEDWCRDAATEGGDDSTVALLVRPDLLADAADS